ncbi:SDR family NAD(P)-dependent oxidoreductase [Rhabdothermincola salaria]|uniref:SDR family NAD(P)-dependent oxidoreductase n=1 Tax=Rhabdothermincola salaria TaxID=2903142 RepID=UPI001E50A473|nr:SDR family oxidoreductase [Rhabdothermincola salaria]
MTETTSAGAGVGPLLQGRVALVTGGGGAIGAASAQVLAAHGADVAVVDVVAERVDEAVEGIERQGGRGLGIVADLTEAGAVEDAVERVRAELGPIEVLVNAVGEHLRLSGPFEESDEAGWDALYRVNLLPVMRASRAVIAEMKERGWGRIVNFSSVEGLRAMPHAAPYTAFKAAVDGFTKSLAVEVAGAGVRVNAIAVDKTRAHQVGFYDLGEEYDPHVPVWVPAGRYGEGADVANVVLFLASDLCSWVVGETIAADGGTLRAGGWYRTPVKWTNSPLLVQWCEDDPEINAARPRPVQ